MIENINTHINHLDSLSNRLFEIKTVLQEMEDLEDYDVYVECSGEGNSVRARVVSDECDQRLMEFKELMGEETNIIYNPDADCYKVDSIFTFWL